VEEHGERDFSETPCLVLLVALVLQVTRDIAIETNSGPISTNSGPISGPMGMRLFHSSLDRRVTSF
jgi:hypothetical protein